jgi:hypothetical protein
MMFDRKADEVMPIRFIRGDRTGILPTGNCRSIPRGMDYRR